MTGRGGPEPGRAATEAGTWVLLRGLTRERGHWGGFVDALAARVPGARVVAPDLPGTGARRDRPSPASMARILDDVRAQLAAWGCPPPYRVLALSLGAMVAIDWARRYPEELEAIVLVNTSVRPFGRPWQRLRPVAWPAIVRVLLGTADPERVERTVLELTTCRLPAADADARVAGWVAIRRARPVSRADALRQLWAAARYATAGRAPAVPALVMVSASDRLVDPGCSRALSAAWGVPLVEHPDAGHDLPLDDGDWVLERLSRWTPAGLAAAAPGDPGAPRPITRR